MGALFSVSAVPFLSTIKINNNIVEQSNGDINYSEQEIVTGNEGDNKYELHWEIFENTVDLTFLKNNHGSDTRASYKFIIEDVTTGRKFEYYDLFQGSNYFRKNLTISDEFEYGTVKLETSYLLTLQYLQGNTANIKTETFTVTFSEFEEPKLSIDNIVLENQSVSNVNDGSISIDFTLNDGAMEKFDKIYISLWDEMYQDYVLLENVDVVSGDNSYNVNLDNLSSGTYSIEIYGRNIDGNLTNLNKVSNLIITYENEAVDPVPSFLIIDGYSTTPDSVSINLFYENNGATDKDINYSYEGGTGVLSTDSTKNFYKHEITGLTSETTYNFEFWFEGDTTKQSIEITTESLPFVYSPFISLEAQSISTNSATFNFSVFDYLLFSNNEVTWTLNDITNDVDNVLSSTSPIVLTSNSGSVELTSLTPGTTYELVLNATSVMDNLVDYKINYVFKTGVAPIIPTPYSTPTVSLNSSITSDNYIKYDFSTLDLARRITGGQINIYGSFMEGNKLNIESIKEISFVYDDLVVGSNGNFYLNEIASNGTEYSAYLIVFDINYLDNLGIERSLDVSSFDLDLIDNQTDKLVLLSTPTSLSSTTWLENYIKEVVNPIQPSKNSGDDSLLNFFWETFLFVVVGLIIVGLILALVIYYNKYKKLKNMELPF